MDVDAFLRPRGEAQPCGPVLRHDETFDTLRRLAQSSDERPDWSRAFDMALDLAQRGHDLRVWVWLTRAKLSAEGLVGLAEGLELIAAGLVRYWDELPPCDATETEPRERYLGRIMALADLGATSSQVRLADLMSSGRNIVDLRADLNDAIARASLDESTRSALGRIRSAASVISDVFRDRFGSDNDPQIAFEVFDAELRSLEIKPQGNGELVGGFEPAFGAHTTPAAADGGIGPVVTRDDVTRLLDLVLAYYEAHEPSSPVPLLVSRAKRLVRMSFLDAIKDLAPAGLAELQTVSGIKDERA